MSFPRAISLLVLAWTLALGVSAQASARESCTAGIRTVGKTTLRTFCGSAKATLHIGGKTYSFTGGSCDSTRSTFSINVGTITLPPAKPKVRYFGITLFTTKDGTFANQAVGWQFPNGTGGALLETTISLQGGRKRGTFAGTTIGDRKRGFGTFSC